MKLHLKGAFKTQDIDWAPLLKTQLNKFLKYTSKISMKGFQAVKVYLITMIKANPR